jgi:hypothetical protein
MFVVVMVFGLILSLWNQENRQPPT